MDYYQFLNEEKHKRNVRYEANLGIRENYVFNYMQLNICLFILIYISIYVYKIVLGKEKF